MPWTFKVLAEPSKIVGIQKNVQRILTVFFQLIFSYMGINIPTSEELIANKLNPQELANYVGADSLEYLSVEGLNKAVRLNMKISRPDQVGHCTACLTGEYPEIPGDLDW